MKRTPLRRVSKRRAEETKEYMKLRKQFLSDHNLCQIWMQLHGLSEDSFLDRLSAVSNGCPVATEIHHRAAGKNRKASYLRTDTWYAVSAEMHRYIHDNPKLAYERGWLLTKIPDGTSTQD